MKKCLSVHIPHNLQGQKKRQINKSSVTFSRRKKYRFLIFPIFWLSVTAPRRVFSSQRLTSAGLDSIFSSKYSHDNSSRIHWSSYSTGPSLLRPYLQECSVILLPTVSILNDNSQKATVNMNLPVGRFIFFIDQIFVSVVS